jgi:hypothetical protein
MNEIFSEKVVTSRRTYYFDVKETREGAKYLVIGELTQVGSELERHRVMVFEESLEFFLEGLDKAVNFILESEAVDEGEESRREGRESAVDRRELVRMLERIEKKVDQVREHFR